MWEAVAADPRWPSLQAQLNEAGRGLGANFDSIADMATWPLNSTADLRAHVSYLAGAASRCLQQPAARCTMLPHTTM